MLECTYFTDEQDIQEKVRNNLRNHSRNNRDEVCERSAAYYIFEHEYGLATRFRFICLIIIWWSKRESVLFQMQKTVT